jgi:hypothetical protein
MNMIFSYEHYSIQLNNKLNLYYACDKTVNTETGSSNRNAQNTVIGSLG